MKKALALILALVLVIGICPQISAVNVPIRLQIDYEPEEMPENLFTGSKISEFYSSPNYNHHNMKFVGEEDVISHEVSIKTNYDKSLTFTAHRDLPNPNAVYALNEETGYREWDGVSYNYNWPLSGCTTNVDSLISFPVTHGNVVFSFDAYNSSPYTAPVFGAMINIGRYYKYRKPEVNESEYPIEYNGPDKGLEVNVRKDDLRQKFSGTFIDNEKYSLKQYGYIIGMPEGTPKGAMITLDSIYFGMEEAYDIEVVPVGNDSIVPGVGGNIKVSAKILNQVGTTGGLTQGGFDWYALTEDRKEYAQGITITEEDNGTATVNIDASVPTGTYTIVAESDTYDGYIKGVNICVGYKDYTPDEMPKNYLTEGKTASDLLSMNYNAHVQYGAETSTYMDVYVKENTDGSVVLTAMRDLLHPHTTYKDTDDDGIADTADEGSGVTHWGFSGATTSKDALTLPQETGALVYSFKVSNNNTSYTPRVNFGRDEVPLYPVEYNGVDRGMEIQASKGKWQVFCGTIPADTSNKLSKYSYSLGMPKGTPKGASVIIKADEMYFGIEEAYDIENRVIGTDRVYVGQGGTISVDADIVNQIYSTGDLPQGDFMWKALNANRTEEVSGITITPGEDGTATVTVSPEVSTGVYTIVASSKLYSGFVKGVEIYVVLPEDAAAEGMPQHLARDFEELRTLNLYTINRVGCSSFGGIGYETSSGPLGNSKVLTVTPNSAGGMAIFDIRTEAGNKYNISAWVRADSAAEKGYFVFTNKAIDGGNDVVNEIPVTHTEDFINGEWVYVTAQYSADGRGLRNGERVGAMLSGTVGFRFGSDSTISYAIDDLFIIPEVDNKVDYDNVFKYGSFDTEECLNEWKVWANEGGTLTEEQQKTNGFSYDGYKNKPGALEHDGIRTFDNISPVGIVNVEYGRAYKMSFDAKAIDDEATGQRIWFFMGYSDKAGDGFDPVFNKFYHMNNGQNPTLTKEWQHFEIEFDHDFIARNLAEMTMGFRVSDLQNSFLSAGGRPHYMIDNVSLRQTGGEDFVVSADIYGDVTSPDGATIKFNYVESTKGSFIYRIVRETYNGDYTLKSGVIESETIDFSYTEDLVGDTLRLELVGTDAYGNYSQLYSVPIEIEEKVSEITIEPDAYFWNDDMDILTATLLCEDSTEFAKLNVYTALYTENNRLLSVKEAELATPDEEGKVPVYVDVAGSDDARVAKFFVWYEDTSKPATYADEIRKSVGEFIYVDAQSDKTEENGTKDAPFKSVSAAVAQLENIVATTEQDNIYVVLKSGRYTISETIDLSESASASDKNITFTTMGEEKASISGGKQITGFTEYKNGIYRAPVPDGTMSRQLYVNGVKATRARSIEDVKGFKNLDTNEASTFTNSGLSCTDTSYADYKYPNELELVFIENWNHYYIMPDSISVTDDKAYFTFTDDGNADAWKRLMINRVLAPTVPVYVENASELLDEPGEWYLDTHENYLYYMPRSFENIGTAEVILPVVEQLVVAEGTADAPVKNIRFENIDFVYSAWNLPTMKRYFAPTQALYYQNKNMDSWDGGDEIIEGALHFNNVHNLSFDNCDFAHLGGNALVMVGAVQNCDIIGNEFYEISGNAINMGDVNNGAYAPSEEKYFVKNNEISNNYIHKIADDYYSGAGIVAGYPKDTVIKNNEIADAPYCGIHTGWGWASTATGCTENFVIENNYIHDTMNWRLYDGAPIYVVGRTSGTDENPNLIRGNYIKDTKNPVAGIYPDDGSSYWKITQNVIDASRYPTLHYRKEQDMGFATWLNVWTSRDVGIMVEDNYSTTSHYRYEGSAGSFEQAMVSANADWSDEGLAIVNNSGIRGDYRERFDFDIQMLTLPKKLTTYVGTTENLYYDARTSKDELCDLSDCEITVTSSDESVVTATKSSVTGVSAGKAWITYTVCRKDSSGEVTYFDKYSFCVVVE